VARRAMNLRACALPHCAPLLRRLRRNLMRRAPSVRARKRAGEFADCGGLYVAGGFERSFSAKVERRLAVPSKPSDEAKAPLRGKGADPAAKRTPPCGGATPSVRIARGDSVRGAHGGLTPGDDSGKIGNLEVGE
jgi:hypothetical protein